MRRLAVALTIVVAASIVLEIAFRHQAHAELPWHLVPAFDFVYGIAGSLGLALLSKGVIGRWLSRSEDYYGDQG